MAASDLDKQRHTRQVKRLTERIAELDALLVPAAMPSRLQRLLSTEDIEADWAATDLQGKRDVVAALMTVTVERRGRAGYARVFDPSTIRIEFLAA